MYLVMTSSQFETTNRWLNIDEREKLTGRICSFCGAPLPRGTTRRQTYCEHCPPAGAHRIRMDFRFLHRRWHCEFWDADAGKMLPARLSFEHADSLYTLARRGGAFIVRGRAVKLDFFNAIGAGRGAISLTLNGPQYQKLCAAYSTKCPTPPIEQLSKSCQ
jgi:hypothetical protein